MYIYICIYIYIHIYIYIRDACRINTYIFIYIHVCTSYILVYIVLKPRNFSICYSHTCQPMCSTGFELRTGMDTLFFQCVDHCSEDMTHSILVCIHIHIHVCIHIHMPIIVYAYIYIYIYLRTYLYMYIYAHTIKHKRGVYIWTLHHHCNTLQHAATHCNALQHTAAYWNSYMLT